MTRPVGRIGSTGNSTGPHLHVELQPGRSEWTREDVRDEIQKALEAAGDGDPLDEAETAGILMRAVDLYVESERAKAAAAFAKTGYRLTRPRLRLRRRRREPMPKRFWPLAIYNAERFRGVIHAAEHQARMAELQADFDAWIGQPEVDR